MLQLPHLSGKEESGLEPTGWNAFEDGAALVPAS